MKEHGPCCTSVMKGDSLSWDETRAGAITVPGLMPPPPQLMDGMSTLLDLGTSPATDIGRIHTYVNPVTSTWTEHWVVQPGNTWFTSASRDSRLRYASPQPAAQPWSTVRASYSGWTHAELVFTYQSPPAPGSAPSLPVGTFVFDLRNTAAGAAKGRLFRTVSGTTVRDRWVLFSTYVKPQGNTIAELHPRAGTAQTLFVEALTLGGAGAEYVDVSYTLSVLP